MVELFSIQCTTCQSRLKVRNATIIGDIVACPKCGSMVLVEAPADWQGDAQAPAESKAKAQANVASAPKKPAAGKAKQNRPSPKQRPKSKPKAASKAVNGKGAAPFTAGPPAGAEPEFDPSGDTIDGSQAEFKRGKLSPEAAPETGVPPALPTADKGKLPDWNAGNAAPVRQIALVAGASVLGLILALGLFVTAIRIFSGSGNDPVQVSQADDATNTDNSIKPDADADASEVVPSTDAVEPPPVDGSTPEVDGEEVIVPPVTVDGEEPVVKTDDGEEPVPPKPPEPTDGEEPTDTTEPETDGGPDGEDPFGTGDVKPKDPPAGTNLADDPLLNRFADFIDASPTEGTRVEEPTDEEPGSTDAIEDEAEFNRPSAITIEAEKRLGDSIPAIGFPAAELSSFADFMADFTNTPMTIDPIALRDSQATPGTALSVNLKDSTARKVINKALEPLKLTVTAREKDSLIGYPATGDDLPTRSIPVGDLAPSDADKARLRTFIMELIEPDAWEFNGGEGEVTIEGDTFLIANRPDLLFRSLVLIEKIRVARGLKPLSSYSADRFDLTPRSEQVSRLLNTQLTINFGHGERLTTILQSIHKKTDLWVLVDWQSVAKQGWHHLAEIDLIAHDEPVGEALERLARGMGLVVRVIDGEIVQLVAPKDFNQQFEIEVYRVKDLFDGPPETILSEIRTEIGDGWFQPVGKGAIHYDEPSGAVLVSLTQPQHQALAAFLKSKTRE